MAAIIMSLILIKTFCKHFYCFYWKMPFRAEDIESFFFLAKPLYILQTSLKFALAVGGIYNDKKTRIC